MENSARITSAHENQHLSASVEEDLSVASSTASDLNSFQQQGNVVMSFSSMGAGVSTCEDNDDFSFQSSIHDQTHEKSGQLPDDDSIGSNLSLDCSDASSTCASLQHLIIQPTRTGEGEESIDSIQQISAVHSPKHVTMQRQLSTNEGTIIIESWPEGLSFDSPPPNGLGPAQNTQTTPDPPPAPQASPITLDDTHISGFAMSPFQPIILRRSRNEGICQIPPPVNQPYMDSSSEFLSYPERRHSHTHEILQYPHQHDTNPIVRSPNRSPQLSNGRNASSQKISECDFSCTLFSLPSDTLHSVSTFLKIKEWSNFGLVNKDALVSYREVVEKIKMHTFHCAVEVLTSWYQGEHSDAKELAMLYASCGVPVYPSPMGHACQTINWRMKVESEKMNKDYEEKSKIDCDAGAQNFTNGAHANSTCRQVDRFYLERQDARNDEYYFPNLTYVEEKGLYYWKKSNGQSDRFDTNYPYIRPQTSGRAFDFVGDNAEDNFGDQNFGGEHHDDLTDLSTSFDMELSFQPFQANSSRHGDIARIHNNEKKRCHNEPKIPLRCHKHLIDRHVQGKTAVKLNFGSISSHPFSLSADFFHVASPPDFKISDVEHLRYSNLSAQNVARPVSRRGPRHTVDESLWRSLDTAELSLKYCPLKNKPIEHSIMSDLELHSYDCKNGGIYSAGQRSSGSSLPISYIDLLPQKAFEKVAHKIQCYETRFLLLLKQRDYYGLDECLLDFWDEFFPSTKRVHFFDRCTPVPRMSKLNDFLTNPCPKAFGTVQCEIERVRVRYRTKGMITGRYYSTYEYRLFIRDSRLAADRRLADSSKPRIDTVLMTAKYRGKYYSGQNDVAAPISNGKNGVNRYVLYTPQESDIDEHFEFINELSDLKDGPRYRQRIPAEVAKMEVSRIQTNFFGTEFQISSPLQEQDPSGQEYAPMSQSLSPKHDDPVESGSRTIFDLKKMTTKRKLKKSSKSKTTTRSRIAARISPFSNLKKHALNNKVEATCKDSKDSIQETSFKEKELGAITYTANVLGNRPRMMNVCIPAVDDETGMPEAPEETWTKNVGDEGLIMSRLKIQQENNNDDTQNPPENSHSLTSLRNRQPWWNVDLGAFVLNFGGRVRVASVKNFQLCEINDHENNNENIMLQFGRIEGRHSFNMDFSYPLSPVQAFAVSISSLQSKLSLG